MPSAAHRKQRRSPRTSTPRSTILPAWNGETPSLEAYLRCATESCVPSEFSGTFTTPAADTAPPPPHDTVCQEFGWIEDRYADEQFDARACPRRHRGSDFAQPS